MRMLPATRDDLSGDDSPAYLLLVSVDVGVC